MCRCAILHKMLGITTVLCEINLNENGLIRIGYPNISELLKCYYCDITVTNEVAKSNTFSLPRIIGSLTIHTLSKLNCNVLDFDNPRYILSHCNNGYSFYKMATQPEY